MYIFVETDPTVPFVWEASFLMPSWKQTDDDWKKRLHLKKKLSLLFKCVVAKMSQLSLDFIRKRNNCHIMKQTNVTRCIVLMMRMSITMLHHKIRKQNNCNLAYPRRQTTLFVHCVLCFVLSVSMFGVLSLCFVFCVCVLCLCFVFSKT